METLDVDLESLQAEAFNQQSTLFEDEIQMRLTLTEEKLAARTIEVNAMNEKYKALLSAHSKCNQQEG